MTDAASPAPDRIEREDGEIIAYHRTPGKPARDGEPGIVFLTGYMSDMTGGKALMLEQVCREWGLAYVRFDYFGHGASSGAFTDGTIGRWADDAVFVLDHLTTGPQILVGSSLGGWIMALAAMRRPQRVAGLLGIAAAPDFTEDLIVPVLTDVQKTQLERDGMVPMACDYDPEPTPVTKRILDEGREHLVLRTSIPFDGPVRLIHGLEDPDVPWQTSLRLAERLTSEDVEITVIKGAGHRLSEDHDLDRLSRTLKALVARVGNG